MPTIEVVGLGELQADLSRIQSKLLRKNLLKLIRPGAQRLRKAVAQRAPVHSGGLLRSLRIRVTRGKNNLPYAGYYVDFGPKAKNPRNGKMVKPYWAIMVHNGTLDKKTRNQRIKPNPFIYEAYEATSQEAADIVLQNIERQLTLH